MCLKWTKVPLIRTMDSSQAVAKASLHIGSFVSRRVVVDQLWLMKWGGKRLQRYELVIVVNFSWQICNTSILTSLIETSEIKDLTWPFGICLCVSITSFDWFEWNLTRKCGVPKINYIYVRIFEFYFCFKITVFNSKLVDMVDQHTVLTTLLHIKIKCQKICVQPFSR